MAKNITEYHVRFKATLDGCVNVLAQNKKDAYIQCRTALEPKIGGVFKDNDTLFLHEKYEIKPQIVEDDKRWQTDEVYRL